MPKLLLAVDSDTIRRVLELTFAASPIQVVTAADGEQAIARIPEERPDVVLADISLPHRSGYDVAAFVKRDPALSHIRVLLLAGAFEPVDEARAAQVKSDGVLAKPFAPRQVLSRVNELLGLETEAGAGEPPRPMERPLPPQPLEFPQRAVLKSGAVADGPTSFVPPAETVAGPQRPEHPDDRELDEYFERLDAAFESLGVDPTAAGRLADPLRSLDEDRRPLPTVDGLIAGDAEPAGPATRSNGGAGTFDLQTAGDPPSGLSARPAPPVPTMADAFAALLAFEEGDRSVPPVRLVPPPAPVIGEDVIEEITRRVLARLAPGAVKGLVTEVVSEVAERLVRQEIERIRKDA